MAKLDEGLSAGHTPITTYDESRWPVVDDEGRKADLIWPDYGGEQIKNIIDERQLPDAWRNRIAQSSAWLLMIRLQKIRADDDIFSRPLTSLRGSSTEAREVPLSDQARLIELLQMLVHVRSTSDKRMGRLPRLVVLLTCWDEMETQEKPNGVLHKHLSMFGDFVASNWEEPAVLGLSALGQRLDSQEPDEDYITQGSEQFGYVILENGTRSADLTLPIRILLADHS